MLSSRVDDPGSKLPDGTGLRAVRDAIRQEIEAIALPDDGEPLYEVFVNEGAAAQAGDADVERHCREQVDQAEVVLVLYNGRAGWASQGLTGICQTELRVALERGPQKVRIVRLPLTKAKKGSSDERFQAFVDAQQLWTSQEVSTTEAIVEASLDALRDATVTMVRERARAGTTRNPEGRGEALRWRRLSLAQRAQEMRAAVATALSGEHRAEEVDQQHLSRPGRLVVLPRGGANLLIRVDAVPAAMSVAAAREIVGQPFLLDHELAPLVSERRLGPVHVVAVHGGVSEAQAVRQLGSPDATFVPLDFGVYVADEIQKVQMVLLSRCIDTNAIYGQVQRLLDWLNASDEGTRLEQRAAARREIVQLLGRLSDGA